MHLYRFESRIPGSRCSVPLCGLAIGLLLLLAVGCGGEVTVTVPGCEDCPERCIQNDSGRGKCVECIKDEQCQSTGSPTKKCQDQKCICGSEGDCPKGQQCAGVHGCVECLRDEHCSSKERPACGPDNRCAACKPKSSRACLPQGSDACVKGTQVCKANGQWDVCTGFKACESNQKCVDEKCVLDCPKAPCQLTENKCTTSSSVLPGKYLRCVKNAKGCLEWDANERDCGDREICDKGQCIPFQCPKAECALDETRCVGPDGYRTCIRDKNKCLVWGDKQACAKDQSCREALKRCTACVPKAEKSCYTGSPGTDGKGPCKAGKQICADDGSGFSACAGEITPQKELCNGKDDDCDGNIDEDYPDKGKACTSGQGACQSSGSQVCKANGLGLECDAKAKNSSPEICDNKDNDCDGNIDDNLSRACYSGDAKHPGKGICKKGTQTCSKGVWSACAGEILAQTETCNGKDDDCDGAVDEGLTKSCYSGPTHTAGKGLCKAGTQTCTGGQFGACTGEVKPASEICDNKDNDCDGAIDESITKACYTGAAGTSGKGPCKAGAQICTNGTFGSCVGQVTPKAEACNNVDDDCNGIIDGMVRTCYTGPANTAGVGICKRGNQTCTSGNWSSCLGQVLPANQENCTNGKDDDCNGRIDDCSAAFFDIRATIDTDTGRINGIPAPAGVWKGNGRFVFTGNLRIPQSENVKVSGSNPLQLVTSGNIIIAGTLDLRGQAGGSTNCSSPGAASPGQGTAGGANGSARGCAQRPPHPTVPAGSGSGGGKGGTTGTVIAGGGGGGGHSAAGSNGLPSGVGGQGGVKYGSSTSLSPGSGGGGGGCGDKPFQVFGLPARVLTPGGGGGGAVLVESTGGNITISGNILTAGGDGGSAPTCKDDLFGTPGAESTGGGGAGGSGGSIRIRAKTTLSIQSTAFLSAEGGKGKGQASAKGGDGSPGYIRLEDNDGVVSVPAGRVLPTPSFATY